MIEAEAKHLGLGAICRHKEKGESSLAAGLDFGAWDLAKIHLLLFTVVCIIEEAGRQAEKEVGNINLT